MSFRIIRSNIIQVKADMIVRSLGWEDPLQKGKATHSSILAWRIPWTTVHGVTKSWTRLSDFHFHFVSYLNPKKWNNQNTKIDTADAHVYGRALELSGGMVFDVLSSYGR